MITSALDAGLAAAALLMLLPLLVIVAILIRLDSKGAVLFCQTRTGLNGKQFRIYKFRTMQVHKDCAIVRQATRGDPRVTRVGYYLRIASLDELPQLINVLRGEMALVGPRPHAVAHDALYGAKIQIYNNRFSVKPGITGWAQVNGSRGPTPTVADMQRRAELDLYYIKNRSVGLNMLIIARTIFAEITRRTDAF
ncbi:sugar transferase [Methylobacterium sp. CM6247]